MHAQHPEIAKRWEQEAKSKGQPSVQPTKKKTSKKK